MIFAYTLQVGDSLTLADVLFAEILEMYADILKSKDFLAASPACKKVLDTVLALPQVAAYLSSDLRYPLGGEEYMREVDIALGRRKE